MLTGSLGDCATANNNQPIGSSGGIKAEGSSRLRVFPSIDKKTLKRGSTNWFYSIFSISILAI
jgi:hypothetical protein